MAWTADNSDRPHRRSWLAAAVLVLLLAGAAYVGAVRDPGIGAGGQAGGHAGRPTPDQVEKLPTLGSLVPTPTADPGDIVLAYQRFWAIAQTVDRRPPAQWRPTLAAVAGQPFLDELLDGFAAARARGTVQYGTVVPRPVVVDLTASRATILDCQDASGSGELDRNTGAVQTVGSARTPFSAVLSRDNNGRWVLTEARYLPGSC